MDIEIKGDIIEDDYQYIYDWIGWSYTSARNVISALKRANGEDVTLKVNSSGGSVFAASEIYTELMNYSGNVYVEILGLAASAASVIAMAGYSRMSPTAQIMVHNVSTSGISGDYRVMDHTAEMLRNANETIASAYIQKSGMSQETALALMDNETWLTASRARELGLIDEIMFESQDSQDINLVANLDKGLKMYNSFSSIPNELLELIKNQPKNKSMVDFFIIEKANAELELLELGGLEVNREDYLKQRSELIEDARICLDKGEISQFNDLKVQIKELDTKFEVLAKEQANLRALENSVSIPAPIVNAVVDDKSKLDVANISSSKVLTAEEKDTYLNAWAKYMLNKTLDDKEQGIFNKVNKVDFRNAAETASANTVLIPETVVTGIWREAGESYPLFGDVVPTFVEGDMIIVKETSSGSDADWYDEDTPVVDGDFDTAEVHLTGCELAKSITVSWKLKKMAIKEFIPYITTILAEKMGAALAKAVYSGKGKPGAEDSFKPQPKGIKTALSAESSKPQIVTYANGGSIGYDELTAAMAKLTKYSNGAVIYANSDMIWNHLAQIKDTTERPLFIPDPTTGGVGRILGKLVKEDDSIASKDLLIGNVKKGYSMNINENVTLYRDEKVKARQTEYMSYAIVDGDVLTTKAFVIITEAAS